MSLLEIKNLSLSFGDTKILRDIDLTIETNEAVGLVGESGSGKSITSLAAHGPDRFPAVDRAFAIRPPGRATPTNSASITSGHPGN
ncbi:MAG: hypothetical protein HRU28_06785, partial [Rhizobiales bacterium]|nr:hypothetical protein [Hyphomicrobiales bacterium]